MKILLADDQSRVRFALRVLLEQQDGWKVVGEVAEARELLERVRITQPDLVVVDWDLPGLDSVELLKELREICPTLRIAVLSEQQELQRAVLEAGADAFASKANPPEQFLAEIKKCENGRRV